MAYEEEHRTHEDKLRDLLFQMIEEENSTDSEAAKHIKSIVRYQVQERRFNVSVEDQQDDDKDAADVIIKIVRILNDLDHNEYPYANIAVEEINKIKNILTNSNTSTIEEEGEEY